MGFSWEDSRRAFKDAADWFVGMTTLVGDSWDRPGLGEWDIRALVGHTSRSLLTVETYLARPAAAVEIPSAADYYRATKAAAADPAVTDRGRQAGAALGADPAVAVAEIASRVLPLLHRRNGTELVTTIAGGMRLAEYMPTRTFELTVHTADLATALEVASRGPRDCWRAGAPPGDQSGCRRRPGRSAAPCCHRSPGSPLGLLCALGPSRQVQLRMSTANRVVFTRKRAS